jgi:hypothetical protein
MLSISPRRDGDFYFGSVSFLTGNENLAAMAHDVPVANGIN